MASIKGFRIICCIISININIKTKFTLSMKLVFLGPPGAGKGTQARLVAEKINVPHISTGDIFRENMKNKTKLGIEAKKIVDQGELVPDEITNAMIQERLNKDDCANGYILDGYPRTVPQAYFLERIQEINKAVYFSLEDDVAVQRLLDRGKNSGRADDNQEVIENRLEVYKEQTQPLIDFYKKKNLLLEIDASPSIEKIFDDVKIKLELP